MARANVIELTDEEVLALSTDRFFKAARDETGAIPVAYDGKYYCVAAIVTNVALTEAQMDDLEAQIDAIAGVAKSFVRIGPVRIPLDRVPAGDDLVVQIESNVDIRTPEV